MDQNSNASNNWKWNYFHDHLTNPDNPDNPNKLPTVSIKDSVDHSKTKSSRKSKGSAKDATQGSFREHSFYTDFDAFSSSLMEREDSEYSEFVIKETDLLSDIENPDIPAPSTAGRTCDVRGRSLLVDNVNDDAKESCLIGTDDELADEYNKAYLNLDGKEESEDLHKEKEEKIDKEVGGKKSKIFDDLDDKQDIFAEFLNLDSTSKMKMDDLMKFDEVESEYFETDCDTIDSGIFPNRETEYFQDIGSDFFDEDEEEETITSLSLSKLSNFKINDKNDGDNCLSSPSSPSSSLPPGKTATMSNSLLRSTICELERALSDSNKLLTQRDEKMQVLRSRNAELKKTLSKEVDNNRKMKRVISEKEKTILENQTKIIDLNQHIHDLNTKLSKIRTEKMQENQATAVLPSTSEKPKILDIDGNADDYNRQDNLLIHETPDEDEQELLNNSSKNVNVPCLISTVPKPMTPMKPPLPPSRQRNHHFDVNSELKPFSPEPKSRQPIKAETDSRKGIKTVKSDDGWSFTCHQQAVEAPKTKLQEDSKKCNNEKEEEKASRSNSNSNSTATGNELQDNLKIKFLRDAFFYYMIGFHPDEQINAILAILEYGDRRQEFVMEAHNMRKVGKKFNVSQVSSRGHSFVQEQFK